MVVFVVQGVLQARGLGLQVQHSLLQLFGLCFQQADLCFVLFGLVASQQHFGRQHDQHQQHQQHQQQSDWRGAHALQFVPGTHRVK